MNLKEGINPDGDFAKLARLTAELEAAQTQFDQKMEGIDARLKAASSKISLSQSPAESEHTMSEIINCLDSMDLVVEEFASHMEGKITEFRKIREGDKAANILERKIAALRRKILEAKGQMMLKLTGHN